MKALAVSGIETEAPDCLALQEVAVDAAVVAGDPSVTSGFQVVSARALDVAAASDSTEGSEPEELASAVSRPVVSWAAG